jgi:serine protease
VLKSDKNVQGVSPNASGEFSVTPADPYFAAAGSVKDYQWGLHYLGMQSVWDLARGHAYVAHLDSGIQQSHPDLLYHPQFSFAPDGGNVEEIGMGFFGTARGHGTHTAGILAAATSNPAAQFGHPNPPSPIGVAGTCWHCTLMVARITQTSDRTIPIANMVSALNWAVDSGAQVVNMSFGISPLQPSLIPYCPTYPSHAFCYALAYASYRDVVISAAVGNQMVNSLQFPARDPRTIAVGGAQSYSGIRGYLWTEEPPLSDPTNFAGSNTGPEMQYWGVVAPARDVLSTVYEGSDWNPDVRCGDNGFGSGAGSGYGICTGTSMAAPFVSGIAGIMRSARPLLSESTIRGLILATASEAALPNQAVGFGFPNPYLAVAYALYSTNRLTPLFAFFGPGTMNYFYTTVPQMGSAAILGTMSPYVLPSLSWYIPVGTSVDEYLTFPGGYGPALAEAWIFTSHTNPANPNVELRPLFRLSFKCGDPLPVGATNSVCATYPYHVDHFYSTDYNEALYYVTAAGYKIDGIEGYVYPPSYTQPSGTEALIRAYNATYDDHAIFPQSLQSTMSSAGYTVNITSLGYIYKNSGTRPIY